VEEYSTPAKTKTATVPAIPLDIVNEIADHLVGDSDFLSVRACTLVSKSWVQPYQQHLFRVINLTSRSADRWAKTFPVPEESPAHYVRDLRVWAEVDGHALVMCSEYTPWFTNVERLSLLGDLGLPSLWGSSFWRLPRSVTSLAIDVNKITLVQVRDIMAQLPNLDTLILSVLDSLVRVDRRELKGIGTILGGSFGGRLVLYDGFIDEDVVNMLSEIPSGLRFTEVQIHCFTPECLRSAIRLTEACRETLVKFTHKVTSQCMLAFMLEIPTLTPVPDADRWEISIGRSYDFSNCPNLQEVKFTFTAGWPGRGLPWIPMALSTLRPTTSPRLSAVRLCFTCLLIDRSVRTLIKDTGNDLRRVASEVSRIEREFEGMVDFSVVSDSVFEMVLDNLSVRFRFVASDEAD